jgi:hypothetical protein
VVCKEVLVVLVVLVVAVVLVGQLVAMATVRAGLLAPLAARLLPTMVLLHCQGLQLGKGG